MIIQNNMWRPDGPDVKDPFNHLLYQALLEEANKGGHPRHVYCYLSEGVLVHILFLVVKVLVDITPAKDRVDWCCSICMLNNVHEHSIIFRCS